MNKKSFLLLPIYLLIVLNIHLAHVKGKKIDFIRLVEKIHQKSGCSEEELYDRLWHFYHNPIKLNQASEEDLAQLGMLSEKQLLEFVNYMAKNAPLLSIYELQAIPSWDLDTISLVKHFVVVGKTNAPQGLNSLLLSKQKLVIGFERDFFVQPTQNKVSLGDSSKLLMSYTQRRLGHYSIGLLAKKDAKELLIKPKHYYLPYWAGHAMIENRGILQKAIIGHYQIGFGQGLIMKSGFNIDKNAEAVYILRANQQGIKPITSYGRKNGFQGFATTLTKADFTTTLYASKRSLDTTLYQTSEGSYVRSIEKRGFIYTEDNVLDKKDTVQEQVLGAALTYCPNTAFELGVQAVDYRYTQPIRPRKNYYNADYFQGDQGSNLGAFGRVLWQNIHFFGEMATSSNQGQGMLAGAMLSLGKWADTAMLWRYYSSNFHAMYGKAFGRNTRNRNEHGLYVGLRLHPSDQVCIASYIDFFKHAKPQYRAHRPTQGTHFLLSVNYQPTRNTLCQLKFKNNRQPYNRSKVSTFLHPILDIHQRSTLSLKLDYPLSLRLRARTQAQVCRYLIGDTNANYGVGVMQRFIYKKEKKTFKAHIALFHARVYGTRLYFYTPNIMPGVKYPMFYGKGIQVGCSIAYPLSRRIRMEAQFSLALFLRKDQLHRKPIFACKMIWQ